MINDPLNNREKKDCGACNGSGYQTKKNGITIKCPVCLGSGKDGYKDNSKKPDVDFTPKDVGTPKKWTEDDCLVDKFFEDNPDKNHAMISCPCPKCSPRMSTHKQTTMELSV